MQKLPIVIILIAFVALFAVCSPSNESAPEAIAPIVAEAAAPTATGVSPVESPAPAPSASPATEPAPAIEPDIPAIVDELDFGVPAGNGHFPQQLVIDSQNRRLYTLNQGLFISKEGNTISIIDLETGQITGLLKLNNVAGPDLSSPTPLDLQLDPYRPRLYALSGDRYGDASATTLASVVAGASP